MLQRNKTLTSLNLETNSISSGGILALADGLRVNRSLRELKLANQSNNCTQQAEEFLAAAIEQNPTLTRISMDVRSTFARETIDRCLLRNGDSERIARSLASKRSTSSSLHSTASCVSLNVANWAVESAQVAASERFEYGDQGDAQSRSTEGRGTQMYAA